MDTLTHLMKGLGGQEDELNSQIVFIYFLVSKGEMQWSKSEVGVYFGFTPKCNPADLTPLTSIKPLISATLTKISFSG